MELSQVKKLRKEALVEREIEVGDGGSADGCVSETDEMSHVVVVETEKWRRRELKLKHRRKDKESMRMKPLQRQGCLK